MYIEKTHQIPFPMSHLPHQEYQRKHSLKKYLLFYVERHVLIRGKE